MVRLLIVVLLSILFVGCGSTAPDVREETQPVPDTAPSAELDQSYGFEKVEINGQEVDQYTFLDTVPDYLFRELSGTELAVARRDLSKEQLASLPTWKQELILNAKVGENESEDGIQIIRSDGIEMSPAEAIMDTPVEELTTFDVQTKRALAEALSPEQMSSLPMEKRRVLLDQ